MAAGAHRGSNCEVDTALAQLVIGAVWPGAAFRASGAEGPWLDSQKSKCGMVGCIKLWVAGCLPLWARWGCPQGAHPRRRQSLPMAPSQGEGGGAAPRSPRPVGWAAQPFKQTPKAGSAGLFGLGRAPCACCCVPALGGASWAACLVAVLRCPCRRAAAPRPLGFLVRPFKTKAEGWKRGAVWTGLCSLRLLLCSCAGRRLLGRLACGRVAVSVPSGGGAPPFRIFGATL